MVEVKDINFIQLKCTAKWLVVLHIVLEQHMTMWKRLQIQFQMKKYGSVQNLLEKELAI